MFKSNLVAIVTPFKDEKVDYNSFEKLINFQIDNGVNGIVVCGTTGESATLSHDEHNEVVRFTVEITKNRVPVIAGTGSNSTKEAVNLTRHAKEVKADGVLMVTPYYNKPSQEGLYKHFINVADEVNIPIILYNIQSRTAVNMDVNTVIKLSEHKNIVGIKEASGSLEQAMRIIESAKDFFILSGDDALTLPICSIGGHGVISVISNVLPKESSIFVQNCLDGNLAKAKNFLYTYLNLIKGMFLETNPVPVKQALSFMGLCSSQVRLPLCEMTSYNKSRLRGIMEKSGLL